MKYYIAYFDYLGFKEFILNNDRDYLARRADHLLRDVETSITRGNYRQARPGVVVADLEKTLINCITISDTVIFWSKDDSEESRELILSIAYDFNWRNIFYNMPLRGVVCFDELDIIRGQHTNPSGLLYSPNLIYGKGLVNSYIKADSLSWAGCVIDQSIVDDINEKGVDINLLEPFAKRYDVPYKNGIINNEYAMQIVEGTLNEESFTNFSNNIKARFVGDNKSVTSPRVQEILENTLAFLSSFRDKVD